MSKREQNTNDEPQSQSIPGTTNTEAPNASTEGGNSQGDAPGQSQGNVTGGGEGDSAAAQGAADSGGTANA